ncbi:MAG: hypothetical protein WCK82_03545 [Bacteroidota bacterium]
MGWKDLFIAGEENATNEPKQEKPVETNQMKFPTNLGNTFPTFNVPAPPTFTPPQVSQIPQEYLVKAMDVYKNGFDSLNQNGYDFYEFYQAITQGGVNNPQIYPMAFTMASAMDKSVTKDKLLQTADFYLGEINKVYNDYVSKGNGKKQDLITQKNNENQALVNELSLMEQQLEALRTQIQDRQNKLNAIGGKYEPMISDVDNKLSANETAKNQIVQSIEQVKTGIIKNLK